VLKPWALISTALPPQLEKLQTLDICLRHYRERLACSQAPSISFSLSIWSAQRTFSWPHTCAIVYFSLRVPHCSISLPRSLNWGIMDQELTGNAFRSFYDRHRLGPSPRPDHTPPASSSTRPRTGLHHPEQRPRQPSTTPRLLSERRNTHRTPSALFQNGSGGNGSSSADTPSSSRRYACNVCDLTFGRKHHRDRHVTNIHGKVRSFSTTKYVTVN